MQKLLLESFDTKLDVGTHPSADFDRGFREGQASEKAAALEMQVVLSRQLVHNIGDLAFKYEEVRGDIIHALGPLFLALTEKVFPQCLADGFANQIVALLLKLAAIKTTAPFHLSVHPQQREAIANAVASAAFEVSVSEDASLDLHTVVITREQEAWQVDCDRLLQDIREILSAAQNAETRKISNV